jgi:hypothetical protein
MGTIECSCARPLAVLAVDARWKYNAALLKSQLMLSMDPNSSLEARAGLNMSVTLQLYDDRTLLLYLLLTVAVSERGGMA